MHVAYVSIYLIKISSNMKKLKKSELKKYIVNFLKSQNMMVLSTCRNNIPRATPLDYYSKGLDIYIYPGEGQKIKNLNKNKTISIGIFAPFVADNVQGMQISSKKIFFIKKWDIWYKEAERVYRWKNKDVYLKIIPEKIEILDFSFKKSWLNIKQEFVV